ncbi:MAG: hypothetical protein ACRDHO_06905, partial [Actinomycetota bacterium]
AKRRNGVRRTLLLLAVVVSVFALNMALAQSAVAHCEGHNDGAVTKVEGQGVSFIGNVVMTVDGPSVSFTDAAGNPVVMQFCVKAGTDNSGLEIGSSFTVDWLNNGGQTPDISYVVVYGDGGGEEPPGEA